MEYKIIKNTFINFFKRKKHEIFPSFPIYLENDSSNLFVNSGMNPFKDYFLGYKKSNYTRIVNIQKCLRVTGKHNDFEQVGYDNYHHTMFEMMGNWSFGDYSREKAIEWAWDLLVNVYNIPKNDIYVTIFIGDKKDKLSLDKETLKFWNLLVHKDHILFFGKEHNFWEMGEHGPCGPCTEIHIDLRNNLEKNDINGKKLINKNHPKVIELWNIVFIEYTRNINNILKPLSIKHVDTGMGIERLCMVLQKKNSSYETDIFYPIICNIKEQINFNKNLNKNQNISVQIIADHLRAIIFSIFDGICPSNNKAGYVIRKILRRAFVHANLFLGIKESFIYKFVFPFIEGMKKNFPELECKKKYIYNIIKSEEISFINIIKSGTKKIYNIINNAKKNNKKIISGEKIFKLYDTYGFPIEISKIIINNNNLLIDENTFHKKLLEQKEKSKKYNNKVFIKDSWIQVYNNYDENIFIGYNDLNCFCYIKKYRKSIKNSTNYYYELVLTKTPFYPEGGGQIGDTGILSNNDEEIHIIDTKKENSNIIHITKKLPNNIYSSFKSHVNKNRRINIEKNHTSTHLLNFVLKKILSNDIKQKGSYVCDDYLRFDFSYNKKIDNEKLIEIENCVQELIYNNLSLKEIEFSSLKEAKKYKDILIINQQKYFKEKKIRIVSFGDSHELCIGTHTKSTGLIHLFKIISESSVSYGIRRIKAVTSKHAIQFINKIYYEYNDLKRYLNYYKNPIIKKIIDIKNKYIDAKKEISKFYSSKIDDIKNNYIKKIKKLNYIKYVCEFYTDSTYVQYLNQEIIKKIGIDLIKIYSNFFMFTGFIKKDKYFIFIFITNDIIQNKNVNAHKIMDEITDKKCSKLWGNKNFSMAIGNNLYETNIFLLKIKKYIKNIFS
ncbi:alanine--tRNA ligase [Blattabacterium cuenoti]|uniref:alanine--tRNA ligase n=1 Tax=Blattabacterium cuenoti TaxID=1653831 RepID=UPI00163B933C|nr:alanine--tRNA ligase [Blattabacterium cuenoti]